MKKIYFKILFFIAFSGFVQAQCSINAISSTTGGCAPLYINFSCPSSYSTVTWNIGSPNNLVSNTATLGFLVPGVYIVTVTAVVPQGVGTCTAIATIPITVVTGSTNGCSNTINVGLTENSAKKTLLIYPNPGNGLFELLLNDDLENAKVILFNALGQTVFEEKIDKKSNTVNCSQLSKGIYSLCVFENEKHFITRKLIIE